MIDSPSSSLESQRQQTAQKESERNTEMVEVRELTLAIAARLELPKEEAYGLAKEGSYTLIDDILIQKYFQSGAGNDPKYIGTMLYEAYLADGTQHIYPDSYDVYNEEDEDEDDEDDDNTSTKINSQERALLEELIPDFMTSLEIEKQEEIEKEERELADKAKRAAKRELADLISDNLGLEGNELTILRDGRLAKVVDGELFIKKFSNHTDHDADELNLKPSWHYEIFYISPNGTEISISNWENPCLNNKTTVFNSEDIKAAKIFLAQKLEKEMNQKPEKKN